MATLQCEAVVLRIVRYGEADGVLALQTLEHGRVSAFAKGIRKSTSVLRGRLQPGTCAQVELVRGKGDLYTVRGAQILSAHAGIWAEGYRIQATSSVLEAALRIAPEEEANPGAYHLLCRSLALLAESPVRANSPRLDPVVVATQLKLLVTAGLLPQLASCVACGAGPPFLAFSARHGGVLCTACAGLGEPVDAQALDAISALIREPLALSAEAVGTSGLSGVERLIVGILRDHLGVSLRSASPA